MVKLGGAPTAVVAAVTVGCGLLLIGGVGPSNEDVAGERPPAAGEMAVVAQVEGSTADDSAPDDEPAPPTTESAEAISPVPISVAPSSVTIGVGGTSRLSGTCPLVDGTPLGPVEIWEVGEAMSVIETGVTAEVWSYDWTAPTEPSPIVLQVWCGDPSGYEGGYPASMQIEVVFVAQVPATTPVAVDPGVQLPATD